MAGSLVSITPMQRIRPVDKSLLKNDSAATKLDVVVSSSQEGGAQGQSSLSKIAKFQPTNLKDFSSNIGNSVSKRKQTSQIKNAEQSLVKEKVQAIKSQNPFANKSPVEVKSGAKVNIST